MILQAPFTIIHASNKITVIFNDTPIIFDTEPIISDGRVLVPMRKIFEDLGFFVDWNEQTQTITALKESNILQMTVNKNIAIYNGKTIPLDVAPTIASGRTLVPLRFISEISNAKVYWNSAKNIVEIDTLKKNDTLTRSMVMVQTNKGQGSGIILSSDGLIATNFHVLKNASTAQILFDDNSIYTENISLVGCDMLRDIAILKIDKDGLSLAKTNSNANMKINDSISVVGSPKGQLNLISKGEITGFNDAIIEVNAFVDKGNSGGALFNKNNEVIGMISLSNGKLTSAIPIALIKKVPINLNVPLDDVKNLPYTHAAPQIIYSEITNNQAYVFFEHIYDVDGYYIYVSTSKDGTYEKSKNPKTNNFLWYWGFPYSFAVSTSEYKNIYIKISSVRNNVESSKSAPLKIF